MLTPVVASSNADAHYHGPPAQSVRSVPEQAGRTIPQTVIPSDAAASTMARVNIQSLTGQLQFIHTMSVLAETLSTIVNLPRRPGETAEEHIERLVGRIRSLPPAERRVVEAQLNLLLQGATLKALAEALKNPSGPDAARLAVMLEMSRYKDRDLAAGAAVKSYRQNSGAELPASSTQGARPAPTPATPSASVTNTSQNSSATGSVIASALQKASDIAAKYIASQSSTQPQTVSAMMREPGIAGESSTTSHLQGGDSDLPAADLDIRVGDDPDHDEPSSPLGKLRSAVSTPVLREKEALAGAAKTPLADVARTDATKDTGRSTGPQQVEDEPDVADARRILVDDRDPRLIRQVAASITQAAQGNNTAAKADSLTNFLMSVLVPGKSPEGAETAPPAAPLPSGEELSEQQNARIKTEDMTASTPRGLSASAEPEHPGAPDARAASVNAQQSEAARNMTIRPEQQSLQAGAMIAAVLGREAIVPLPYVAYLPAKDEPESPAQHRGNAPSGGGDEEAAGEDQQDEAPDEQSADEADASADGDDQTGAEPQGAHDFYQRMSDWN